MSEKTLEYKALHKPNQLIYGTGQTAVVTGWTLKQAIAKHLRSHEYAVISCTLERWALVC